MREAAGNEGELRTVWRSVRRLVNSSDERQSELRWGNGVRLETVLQNQKRGQGGVVLRERWKSAS